MNKPISQKISEIRKRVPLLRNNWAQNLVYQVKLFPSGRRESMPDIMLYRRYAKFLV